MTRSRPFAALGIAALGMVMWLPACAAQEHDDQIIGPAPTIGCCWGNAPERNSPNFAMPIEISSPALATVPLRRGDWNKGSGAD